MIAWTEAGQPCQAQWRSESGAAAPRRVQVIDDTLSADTAYRLACEGTGLLWRGDFHNARQLLSALARRADRPSKSSQRRARPGSAGAAQPAPTPEQSFHLHRQAQAQRARTLSKLLIELDGDYGLTLRRAPACALACTEAWGPAGTGTGEGAGAGAPHTVLSLRELLGVLGAHEWHKKGVDFAALGAAPNNRIHPCYGVFSPVRGEYVALLAQAPLPATELAFDIGVGTGVLSAVLVRRGVQRVLATDQDARALACAQANLLQLGVREQVQLLKVDLFPAGRAPLIVCNPPWLPARANAPIEHAVYDEDSRMLRGFLQGLPAHLSPGGEGWLILSDLAEHLGLRPRAQLLDWIAQAGLTVLGRLDARPLHPKARDTADPLHAARAAEVTSLWRLGVAAL